MPTITLPSAAETARVVAVLAAFHADALSEEKRAAAAARQAAVDLEVDGRVTAAEEKRRHAAECDDAVLLIAGMSPCE